MQTVTIECFPDQPPPLLTATKVGRENLVLRALIRQVIPMLTCPHSFRSEERRQLAQTLSKALDGCLPIRLEDPPFEFSDADAPPKDDEDADYEPGSLLEGPAL